MAHILSRPQCVNIWDTLYTIYTTHHLEWPHQFTQFHTGGKDYTNTTNK